MFVQYGFFIHGTLRNYYCPEQLRLETLINKLVFLLELPSLNYYNWFSAPKVVPLVLLCPSSGLALKIELEYEDSGWRKRIEKKNGWFRVGPNSKENLEIKKWVFLKLVFQRAIPE